MKKTCIRAVDLTVSYGKTTYISEASFEFTAGDVVLLEGANGTGKTTLLKTILGFGTSNTVTNGEIYIGDSSNTLSMNDSDLSRLHSQIGYLEQKDYYDSYYGITVRQVLADSLEAYKQSRLTRDDYRFIEEVFEKYKPGSSNISLKSKVNKLSGGQQRIVSIIASLCIRKDADYFIIDEPLNNLDINTIVHISNLLNQIRINNPQAIMIIVSHCKIFPFITKVATIKDKHVVISDEGIICNACFGEADERGFYVS